ncbi:MAG: hypothetical protein GY802_18885 [Gammaproteobacteria bacterium]|nr:hypothetical protein [Gammaproteobacteria bacterium]
MISPWVSVRGYEPRGEPAAAELSVSAGYTSRIQFRPGWQQNTLAMWDNRCIQHYALNDYHGYRRVMHRIIVEGERPE